MANAANFRINQLSAGTYGLARRDILPTTLAGVPAQFEALNPGLTYLWEIIQPPGSTATIATPNAQTTTCNVESRGGYVVKLTVNFGLPTEDVCLIYIGLAYSTSGLCGPALNETIEDNSQGTPEYGWGEKFLTWMAWVEANIGGGSGGLNWGVSEKASSYSVQSTDKYSIFISNPAVATDVTFTLPSLASVPNLGDPYFFYRGGDSTVGNVIITTPDGVLAESGALEAFQSSKLQCTNPGGGIRVELLSIAGGIPLWGCFPLSGEWYDPDIYGAIHDASWDILPVRVDDDKYFSKSGESPFGYGTGGPTAVRLGHQYALAQGMFSFAHGDQCDAQDAFSSATGRGGWAHWDAAKAHAAGFKLDITGLPMRGSMQMVDVPIYGYAVSTDSAAVYVTNKGRETVAASIDLELGSQRAYVGQVYLVGKEQSAVIPAVAAYIMDFVIDDNRLVGKNILQVGRDTNAHIDDWDVDLDIVGTDKLGISVEVDDGTVWWSGRIMLSEMYAEDRP